MLRATLANLAARKARLLTTGIAVVLGVAFMAGTLVLTDTLNHTFDSLFADANAGVDAQVRADSVTGDGMRAQRANLDAGLIDDIRNVVGVASARAVVEGYAQLLDQNGDPLASTGGSPTGAAWLGEGPLNPFSLVAGGPPTSERDVVIDRSTAGHADLDIGDRAAVLTQAGRRDVRIVGIARFGSADGAAGSSFVLFDLATAQELLGSPGQVDAVRVAADVGVSESDLRTRVARAMPDGVEVLTGAEITAEEQSAAEQGLSFFSTFLLTFALIALFVGSFIIYNTFSILVAQRTQETALLRAVGASGRQVVGLVLAEAVAVGVVASALGAGAGVLIAAGLKAVMSAIGIVVPGGGLVVTTSTIFTSMATGVLVSTAAAVIPARRAATVPPVAAMRAVAVDDHPHLGRRMLVGSAMVAVGGAAMAAGLSAQHALALVGVGVALVFLGVTVLGPVIAVPVTRVLGAPVARLRGTSGKLARENAVRNPNRTAATAAALMVGVSLVAAITVLASSAKSSVDGAVRTSFAGDLVVDAGGMNAIGFSPALADAIADLPEIGAVTGVSAVAADVEGRPSQLVAMDPAAATDLFDLGRVEGTLSELGEDEIAMSTDRADAEGVELGDTISLRFAETGLRSFTLAATYTKTDVVGDHMIGLDAYDANAVNRMDVKVFAAAAEGVSLTDAKDAVSEVAEAYPQAQVQDRDEFAGAAAGHIDEMLNLVFALLFLAVLIALIGIANTLLLSVMERTHEIGLLRAIGMTAPQVRSTVRWESVLVALFGASLGLVVGTLFGWVLVQALADQGITRFVVPGGHLVAITTLSALAGVVAAVLPARRAARLDVLAAIADR